MIGSKQKYKFCNILFSTLLPCEFHMLDQCQDFMTHILLYLRRSKDQYLRVGLTLLYFLQIKLGTWSTEISNEKT